MPRQKTKPGMQYLWQRGNVFWFQRIIPERQRHLFDGYPHYTRGTIRYSLKTSDIRQAKILRDRECLTIDQILQNHREQALSEQYAAAVKRAKAARVEFIDRGDGSTIRHDHADAALDAMLDKIDDYGRDEFADLSDADKDKILRKLGIDPVELAALRYSKHGIAPPEAYSYSLLDGMRDLRKQRIDVEGMQDSPRHAVGKIKSQVERFLADQGRKDIPLAGITKPMVRDWIKVRTKAKDGEATLRDRLVYLGQVWRYAVDEEKISDLLPNPFAGQRYRVPKEQQAKPRKPIEKAQLLQTMRHLKPGDDLPPLISWYTGATVAEIVNLRPEDIIEAEGILCFRFAAEEVGRKTDQRTRIVPVHDDLKPYIEQFLCDGNIANPERSSDSDAYGKRFATALRRVTTDRQIVFHSIRHTVGNLLQQQHGYPTESIEAVTGHLDSLTGRGSSALHRDYRHEYFLKLKLEIVQHIEPLRYTR